MTKSQLLHEAFDVPGRDLPIEPCDARCAIGGVPLAEGVPVSEVLTRATAAPHEIFPHATSGYLSVKAAECYKYFNGGLTGNLLAVETDDGARGWKPMISESSARRKDRPCWQKVVYGTDPHATLPRGAACLAVFTEEFQRRLWIDTPVCRTGGQWRPYLFDGSTRRTLTVVFEKLRRVLALCEYTYSLGFTKDHLRESLLGAQSKMALLTELGPTRVGQLNVELQKHRGTDELRLAAFICQRAGFDLSDSFSDQIAALEAPERYTCLIPKLESRKTQQTPSTPGPATTSSESRSRQTGTSSEEKEGQGRLFD